VRETSIFESVWVLLGALTAAIAAAVWFMLPLNEAALQARAQDLLASEKWIDWNEARDSYLQPMVERFPDGQRTAWAMEKIDWVNGREAERRLDRDERLGRKDNWTQAQIQYSEARRFERFGDLVSANDKFHAIENLFADREDDRAIVVLAREGIARIQENGLGESLLKNFIENKLAEAQVNYEKARVSEAKSTLESIVELYTNNQEVAELVEQAQSRLDAFSRDKSPLSTVPGAATESSAATESN
jgi:eukaryotic-like serine/threonine-protein kinase